MEKKEFLDIVDIVGQYVKLAPEGPSHFLGKCPFCAATEDSLILSTDTQYWHCLSCGANGDRYDFVARSENIGRAEAILAVGHYTNTGEPFPHARFRPGPPKVETKAPAAAAPAPPRPPEPPRQPAPPKPPEPTKPPAAPAPAGAIAQGLAASFTQFRNIIPSYQGATILDAASRSILSDSSYSSSAGLDGIGAALSPVLAHARAAFSKWGMQDFQPATLTLASEDLAILVYQFGPRDKPMLWVVRLANPADAAVTRRLVASASAKLA